MISRFLSTFIILVIRFYQRLLNPMLKVIGGPGMGCRYEPSCSNYFLQSVQIHGPFLGSWFGICRILRCHPWGGCGYDPVPSLGNAGHPSTSCSCNGKTPHL